MNWPPEVADRGASHLLLIVSKTAVSDETASLAGSPFCGKLLSLRTGQRLTNLRIIVPDIFVVPIIDANLLF